MSRVMKDSGIPWIGEIPKEWMFLRFKFAGKFVKGKLPETSNNENIGLPIIGASEILGKECRLYTEDVNIPTCTLNDVIILWDGANAGITATNLEGVISSTAVKYSCKDNRVYKKYMAFLMKYAEYYFKEKVGGTTIPHMNIEYINDFPLLSPTLDEQRAIADFLDVKCAEVDELIALQEKMIDELKVYKQSVITEAVTKGLNPDAPLKDSGIEWIGQIPQHWEVRRLKNIGSAQNGLTYSPIDVCDENQGILVLRSSNIQDGKLAFDDNVYVSVNKVPNNLLVCKGDIIICSRNGSASLVGKSALVTDDISACFGAFMMRFRSNEDYRYTYNLLTAAITQYKQLFSTSTINQLTIGIFSGLAMPFTRNKEEQQQIADYLDTKCAEIDEMTSIKQKKIEQLKEYKKSIIYEYVTGKRQII